MELGVELELGNNRPVIDRLSIDKTINRETINRQCRTSNTQI